MDIDNVEESLLSGPLGSSYVVGRPRIATVTFNTTQPAPVSSTTNAVAMPHPSPHRRSVATPGAQLV